MRKTDDSVTQLTTINQLKDITKPNQDVNVSNVKTSSQISAEVIESSECDTSCVSGCNKDSFYAVTLVTCVTLGNKIYTLGNTVVLLGHICVGGWACAYCRQLPKTVKHMKTQLETLFESTSQILNTIGRLTENMEVKFTNLNDRLTSIANQNKTTNQSSTASLTSVKR